MRKRITGTACFLVLLLCSASIHAQDWSKLAPPFRGVVEKHYPDLDINGSLLLPEIGFNEDGEPYYNSIIITTGAGELKEQGFWIRTTHSRFATAFLTVEDLVKLAAIEYVQYVRPARKVPMHNDVSSGISGVDILQQGLLNNTAYKGEGVLVSVIDNGLDWTHLDFRQLNNPSQTRVYRIWDQTLTPQPGEQTPQDRTLSLNCCDYGVEYTRAEINNELDGTPPGNVRTADPNGHGTHVTGTAAGNGQSLNPRKYIGMAPESPLLIVKTTFFDANIIDAITYVDARATDTGLATVLNMSLGGHNAPHDGTDPMALKVDTFAGRGRVAVISAGNSGSDSIHVAEVVPDGGSEQIQFQIQPYLAQTGTQNDYWYATFWFESDDTITAQLTTPNNHSVSSSSGISQNASPDGLFQIENDVDPLNNDRYVDIIILDYQTNRPPAAGTYTITFTNPSGGNAGDMVVHGWVYAYSVPYYPSTAWNTQFTVASPGTSEEAITVGSYGHRWVWSDYQNAGHHAGLPIRQDTISTFSSIGPTRDSVLKPNLTAPGQMMISSLSQDATASQWRVVEGQKHWAIQGTSMAAPVVSGSVALLLHEDSTMTAHEVKTHLTNSARTDPFTGNVPNTTWGWGKLDALGAMVRTIDPSAVATLDVVRYDDWEVLGSDVRYTDDSVAVLFEASTSGRLTNVIFHTGSAYSLTGDLVFQVFSSANGQPDTAVSDTFHYPRGKLIELSWHMLTLDDDTVMLDPNEEYFVVMFAENQGDYFELREERYQVSGRTHVTSTSGWAQQPYDARIRSIIANSGSVPIPVELMAFNARKEGTGARLDWMTASEKSNHGFVVEQMVNNRFDSIGFVSGHGNSHIAHRYTFFAPELQRGYNYFRLRQVDLDGDVSYSPIRVVENLPSLASLIIAPNPVKDDLSVTFSASGESARYRIFSLTGKVVNQGELEGSPARLDLSTLPQGIFVLEVESGREIVRKKLVKR